jgi:hypothetical protein
LRVIGRLEHFAPTELVIELARRAINITLLTELKKRCNHLSRLFSVEKLKMKIEI